MFTTEVEGGAMKRIVSSLIAITTVAGILALMGHAARADNEEASPIYASPIYGVTIPPGYRDWKMIAVNQLQVPGKVDQLRAQFGNEIAIHAYEQGTRPFPDGSIIVALHWNRVPSE